MRMWHKDLIQVLPRKQLVAQWRELCAIIGKTAKCGTPNMLLVNKVLQYPPVHFIIYANTVVNEMKRRGYKVTNTSYFAMMHNLKKSIENNVFDLYTYQYVPETIHDVYKDWHDTRYYMQCYCNLQEKYDCGGIAQEEWKLIEDAYYKIVDEEIAAYVRQ